MSERKQLRLKNYEYSAAGYYFVTICVQDRVRLFGEIINNEMILNETGEILKFTWFDLVNHNANIILDHFVIMPNHIHGIIQIVGAGSEPAFMPNGAGLEPAPTTLAEIVRQFKTFSSKRINKLCNTPGTKIWQRNYYERVIRNEKELNNIRQYIQDNPINWEFDENYCRGGFQTHLLCVIGQV